MGAFDSAWLKWGRAVFHAHALEADIAAFGSDAHRQAFGRVRHQYEPKRHGFSLRVEKVLPIPARWNVALGDVASNLRCSLDHLAWQIVQRGTQPANLTETQERSISFPITTSPSHYRKIVGSKLPGARRADLAHVRRMQPWNRGKTRTEWHCFTVLDSVVQSDKHREIQGLWMVPDICVVHIESAQHCEPGRMRGRRVLMEVDTEIGFIQARKTGPNPNIQVQYEITSYPAFHPRLWLQQWMDVSIVTVMGLLSQFAQMPEEIVSLGVNLDSLSAAIGTWNENAALWDDATGRRIPMLPNPTPPV